MFKLEYIVDGVYAGMLVNNFSLKPRDTAMHHTARNLTVLNQDNERCYYLIDALKVDGNLIFGTWEV